MQIAPEVSKMRKGRKDYGEKRARKLRRKIKG